MYAIKKHIAGLIAFVFLSGPLGPPAATGITIKEEEDLAREFLRYVTLQFEIIDDPIIVEYVNSVGKKILAKVPPQPFPYHFYVVKQDVYNAFATPAGHVFVYSGLIEAMDNEDELAGILAHEISHVICRHISQKIERSKLISIATLAGVAAGMLLGAAGGGQAAGALTMGSMAAGQSASLAFSRENEIQADQVGMVYLTDAGYTGEGLLTVLNKIRAKQWYGSNQVPTYLMTHPAVEDRLAYIDTYLASRKKDNKTIQPVNTEAFRLVHALGPRTLAPLAGRLDPWPGAVVALGCGPAGTPQVERSSGRTRKATGQLVQASCSVTTSVSWLRTTVIALGAWPVIFF